MEGKVKLVTRIKVGEDEYKDKVFWANAELWEEIKAKKARGEKVPVTWKHAKEFEEPKRVGRPPKSEAANPAITEA